MKIDGVAAVVTGGASGLGLATAARLVSRGAHVVLADLSTSDGREAAAHLGSKAQFIAANVLDERSFGEALDAAERFGPLRAVVHCAGRGGDRLRILDKEGNPGDPDSFAEIIRIN